MSSRIPSNHTLYIFAGSLRNKCQKDGIFPDLSDCTRFYMCSAGKRTVFQCPAQLRFNPDILVCDWPINVVCMKDTITEKPSPGPRLVETTKTTAVIGSKTEYAPYSDSTINLVKEQLTSNDAISTEGVTPVPYSGTSNTSIKKEATEEIGVHLSESTKATNGNLITTNEYIESSYTTVQDIATSQVNNGNLVTHEEENMVHSNISNIQTTEVEANRVTPSTRDDSWVQNTEQGTRTEQITKAENAKKEDVRTNDETIPDHFTTNEGVSDKMVAEFDYFNAAEGDFETEISTEETASYTGINAALGNNTTCIEDSVTTYKPSTGEIKRENEALATKDYSTSQLYPITISSSLQRNDESLKYTREGYQENINNIVNVDQMNLEGIDLDFPVKEEVYMDTTHNTVPLNSEVTDKLIEPMVIPHIPQNAQNEFNVGGSNVEEGSTNFTPNDKSDSQNLKGIVEQEKVEAHEQEPAAQSESAKTSENIVTTEYSVINDNASAVTEGSGKAENSGNKEALSMKNDISTVTKKTTQPASVSNVEEANNKTKSNLLENITDDGTSNSKLIMITMTTDSTATAQQLSSSDVELVPNLVINDNASAVTEESGKDENSGNEEVVSMKNDISTVTRKTTQQASVSNVEEANNKTKSNLLESTTDDTSSSKLIMVTRTTDSTATTQQLSSSDVQLVPNLVINDNAFAVTEESSKDENSGNEEAVIMKHDISTVTKKTKQQASVSDVEEVHNKTKSNLLKNISDDNTPNSKVIMVTKTTESTATAQQLSSSRVDLVHNLDINDNASAVTEESGKDENSGNEEVVSIGNDISTVAKKTTQQASVSNVEEANNKTKSNLLENISDDNTPSSKVIMVTGTTDSTATAQQPSSSDMELVPNLVINDNAFAVTEESGNDENSENEEAVIMKNDISTVTKKTKQQASVPDVEEVSNKTKFNLLENIAVDDTFNSKVIMVTMTADSTVAAETAQQLSSSNVELVPNLVINDNAFAVTEESGNDENSENEEAVIMKNDISTVTKKTKQQASVPDVEEVHNKTKSNLLENVADDDTSNTKLIMVTRTTESTATVQQMSSSGVGRVPNLVINDHASAVTEESGKDENSGNEEAASIGNDISTVAKKTTKQASVSNVEEVNNKTKSNLLENISDDNTPNSKVIMVMGTTDSTATAQQPSSSDMELVPNSVINDNAFAVTEESGNDENSENEEAVIMKNDISTVTKKTKQQASVPDVEEVHNKTKSNLLENVADDDTSNSKLIMVTRTTESTATVQQMSSSGVGLVPNLVINDHASAVTEESGKDKNSGNEEAVSMGNDISTVTKKTKQQASVSDDEEMHNKTKSNLWENVGDDDTSNSKVIMVTRTTDSTATAQQLSSSDVDLVPNLVINDNASAVTEESGKDENSGNEEAVIVKNYISTVTKKTNQQASVSDVEGVNNKTKSNLLENVADDYTFNSKVIMATMTTDSTVAAETAQQLSSSDVELVTNKEASHSVEGAREDKDIRAVLEVNEKQETVVADSFIAKSNSAAVDSLTLFNSSEKVDLQITKQVTLTIAEETSKGLPDADANQEIDGQYNTGGMSEGEVIIGKQIYVKEGTVTSEETGYKAVPNKPVNDQSFVSHAKENVVYNDIADTEITEIGMSDITPASRDDFWVQKIEKGTATEGIIITDEIQMIKDGKETNNNEAILVYDSKNKEIFVKTNAGHEYITVDEDNFETRVLNEETSNDIGIIADEENDTTFKEDLVSIHEPILEKTKNKHEIVTEDVFTSGFYPTATSRSPQMYDGSSEHTRGKYQKNTNNMVNMIHEQTNHEGVELDIPPAEDAYITQNTVFTLGEVTEKLIKPTVSLDVPQNAQNVFNIDESNVEKGSTRFAPDETDSLNIEIAKQQSVETDKHQSSANSEDVKRLENFVIAEDQVFDKNTSAVAEISVKPENSGNEQTVSMNKHISTIAEKTTSAEQVNFKKMPNLIENVSESSTDLKMDMVRKQMDSLVAGEIVQEWSSSDVEIHTNKEVSDTSDDTVYFALQGAKENEVAVAGSSISGGSIAIDRLLSNNVVTNEVQSLEVSKNSSFSDVKRKVDKDKSNEVSSTSQIIVNIGTQSATKRSIINENGEYTSIDETSTLHEKMTSVSIENDATTEGRIVTEEA
nr:unnamed protein product [Callosobruchus analis]